MAIPTRRVALPVTRFLRHFGGLCAVGLFISAQASAQRLEMLGSPAPPNSQLSRVTSDEAGQVFLSWVTRRDETAMLAYARLEGRTWSVPATISQGSNWFVNWADFPAVSVHRGNMVAHWLEMSDKGSYDYNVVARFFDGARQQWGESRVINTDGVSAEHGFVSMLPLEGQGTLVTWLDGRNTRTTPEPGAMTLRAAIFDVMGERQSEWELDPRVCDCCQTASALAASGPVVVYRDRSPAEIRDTSIVRLTGDDWTQPQTVHNDDWQVSGCPVNGPSVSARGNALAVAWFTAQDQIPSVRLAISRDGGASFSAPVTVAATNTHGRIDTAVLDSGEFLVSWVAAEGSTAAVMLSRFGPDAKLIDQVDVAQTSASRRSGFPVIEAVGNTAYVTWTDISGTPRIRIARVLY